MKIFLTIFFFISSQSIYALSMRDCAILPITDTAGDALGAKIYERLEEHLKEKMWCNFRPSSDVLGILSKYRENLSDHLENELVLKTIADRLNAGSLIKISLEYSIDSVNVQMEVIGQTGSDKLFSEAETLDRIEEDQIFRKIASWLEIYEESIPYDGKIIGVLGNQITFSAHKQKVLSEGQEFEVRRVVGKRKHPLLKKIVEWDSILLGKGKISKLSDSQILGIVKVYTSEKKPLRGDWIVLKKPESIPGERSYRNKGILKNFEEGRLGEVELGLSLSSTTLATSPSTGNLKYGGYTYGIDVSVEAWVTRNFFAYGKFDRQLGNLSISSGTADSEETGLTGGSFKIAGGYKYLPLGFFYGPQINLYSGWVNYTYAVDSSEDDGLGSVGISGIMVGGSGSIPIRRGVRAFARGEVIPFPEFKDEDNVYGSNKKTSSLLFNVGLKYQLNPLITLVGSFESLGHTLKFKGSNSEYSVRNNTFKLSTLFRF